MANQSREPKRRRPPRYVSRARAYIKDILDEDSVLKNIGLRGCCIASKKQADIKIHELYVIHILPEHNGFAKFELMVESRWLHSKGDSCEIGFSIISSPHLFVRYKTKCRRISEQRRSGR